MATCLEALLVRPEGYSVHTLRSQLMSRIVRDVSSPRAQLSRHSFPLACHRYLAIGCHANELVFQV